MTHAWQAADGHAARANVDGSRALTAHFERCVGQLDAGSAAVVTALRGLSGSESAMWMPEQRADWESRVRPIAQ